MKSLMRLAKKIIRAAWTFWAVLFQNRISMWRNARHVDRKLEIGPGHGRLEGFETLNVVVGRTVDYVLDCSRPLPFKTGSFTVVYASHVLEHVPWYMLEATVNEWVRILSSNGVLEIWVPDGEKICSAFVNAERQGDMSYQLDGWYRFNPSKDPCAWASGRTFSYGDGEGTPSSPNWHRSLFSCRYLIELLEQAGLAEVTRMDRAEVRGFDHGWINLGVKGVKP